MPVLSCHGLSKSYAKQPALRGLQFSLEEGKLLALLGPNGAGKSTLFGCLTGLLNPDAGDIQVLGKELSTLQSADRQEMGYVPQEFSGFAWMRVGELLDYFGAFYARERRKWPELEDWARLDRSKRIKELSGGQRQRLSIVLAMRHRPRLLLLDEPVSGLDPVARRDFLGLLTTYLRERPAAVLLSSHIVSDLEEISDVALIMDHGMGLGPWSRAQWQGQLAWLRGVDGTPIDGSRLPPGLALRHEKEGACLVDWGDEFHGFDDPSLRVEPVRGLEDLYLSLAGAGGQEG